MISIALLACTLLLPAANGEAVIALYDPTSPGGLTQHYAYTLAVDHISNITNKSLEIVYQPSKRGVTEANLVHRFIADRLSVKEKIPVVSGGEDFVIVGGGCHSSPCQIWYPQVVCSDRIQVPQANVLNMMATLESLYPAVLNIVQEMQWNAVCIFTSDVYVKEVDVLVDYLSKERVTVILSRPGADNYLCTSLSQAAFSLDADSACSAPSHVITFWLLLDEQALPCSAATNSIISITHNPTALDSQIKRKLGYHLTAVSNIDLNGLDRALCSYNSMLSVLSALLNTSAPDELLKEIYQHSIANQRETTGKKTTLSTDIGPVILRRENGIRRVLGVWTQEMGLNLTENITVDNNEQAASSTNMNFDTELVLLGVMSSFALLGIIYSVALIAFNCSKSKDRTIKLTSPNINMMTCLGSLLTLLSIPLLGLERQITTDLSSIAQMQQAALFTISVGVTIIYSSILVKTWRVHRIFKKMHLSSKGTKDEHLILMIIGLTLIDVSINTVWAKVDPMDCVEFTYSPQEGIGLICSSRYQVLWSCLLASYKLIITVLTLFYAWHVRHVKLPSLQDSHFILTNSLVLTTILLTSLPTLAYSQTTTLTRFTTVSMSVLAMVFSTFSLLLAPKMFLIRNKEDPKSKFLFGKSIMKQNDKKEEPNRGCWARFKSCNSHSGSTMGDSVLSQEIETLKQLVKEKDDTIRELTDRLFFGADRFKAYVNEKTMTYRRTASHPANLQGINVNTNTCRDDNYQSVQLKGDNNRPVGLRGDNNQPVGLRGDTHQTNALGRDSQQSQRSRLNRYQHKSHSLPQFSPVSSVDSGNVEDAFTSRRQWKSHDYSCYTLDNSVSSKYAPSKEGGSTSHTLPPIRELSANDLANHCSSSAEDYSGGQLYCAGVERSVTPTTDSAINMSRSVSSSEDESYSHKYRRGAPNMYEVADRVRHMILRQSDDMKTQQSESNSSDHTLESNCTVLTTGTLSPSEEGREISLSPTNDSSAMTIGGSIKKTGSQSSLEMKPFRVGGEEIRPSIECERLAASSRRQSSKHRTNHYQGTAATPNLYTVPIKYCHSPAVGDEVEMEIVLPASNDV